MVTTMEDMLHAAPAPVVLGEVLFDAFPDGREILGGAPFNVAWHLRGFGLRPRLVTRVGDDPQAAVVRDAMSAWNLDARWVQTDPDRATGRVVVSIDDGEPSFSIPSGQAWDRIAAPEPPVFGDDDGQLLYHGSLALREMDDDLVNTLLSGLRARSAGVFMDVNLRDPWWDADRVAALMVGADWVKLNHHELAELAPDGAAALCDRCGLTGAIITEGAARVRWWTADGIAAETAPPRVDDLADAVGAGDAFSSVCLVGLSGGWDPGTILERAAVFAADVCRQRGATAVAPDLYERPWNAVETRSGSCDGAPNGGRP